MEESVGDMEQAANPNSAAAMDVQIKHGVEECALSMEQRSNYAAAKGAPIKPESEESAGDTGLTVLSSGIRRKQYWYCKPFRPLTQVRVIIEIGLKEHIRPHTLSATIKFTGGILIIL